MNIEIDIERMNDDELEMLLNFLYREGEMRKADIVDKRRMFCEDVIDHQKWEQLKSEY